MFLGLDTTPAFLISSQKSLYKIQQEKKTKERKKRPAKKSKTINKMAIRTYILIITLNVNRVNALTKRQRLAELRDKERIVHMWSTRDQPQI